MADVVGDALIRISADSSNFGRELTQQTGQAGESAAKSMASKVGKTLSTGFKVVAASVGTAAGLTLGVALNKGFNRLAAIENAESKLKILLKSTEDVEKAMEAANAAVTGTAFGMDEAATAVANLASSNVPLENMESVLTLVADAATVGGTSLTEMSSIFSKVASNGKVSTDVLNQFGDRGIGATKALADQLGVTQEAVREMVSNGEIDFATFQKAMEKMVGGAAQEAGGTVSGSMANVGAALSRLGAALLAPIFERLPEVFTNLQTAIGNVTKAVGPLAERYGPALGGALVKISEWLANVDWTPFINGISGAVSWITDLFKQLDFSSWDAFKQSISDMINMKGNGTFVESVGPAFESIKESLKALQPAWEAFREELPKLGPAAATATSAGLELLVKVLAFLADHVDTIIKFMPLIVAGFVAWKVASVGLQVSQTKLAATQAAMTPLITANNVMRLTAIRLEMRQTASTSSNTAAQTANNASKRGLMVTLGAQIKTMALATAGWVRDTAVMVAHKTAQLASVVATKAVTLAQKALNAVMRANPIGLIITAITLLVGIFIKLYKENETVRRVIDAVWAAIKGAIMAVVDWFKDTAVPFLQAAWEAIKAGFTSIKDTAVAVWDWIKDAVKKGIDFVTTLFFNFTGPGLIIKHWDTIKGAFQAGWDWIKTTFSRLWDGLKNILQLPVELAKKQIEVLLGAATGLRSIFTKVKDWVVTTFKASWDRIQETIQAPIRWAKDAIAGLIGTGGYGGITGVFNRVRDWVKTTFKKSWDAIQTTLQAPVQWAKDKISTIIWGIRQAFEDMKNAVPKAFEAMKKAIKTPIDWIVTNVINPFLNSIKSLLKAVGLKGLADKLPLISTTGGALSGAGTAALPGAAGGGRIPGVWSANNRDHVLGVDRFGIPTARVEPDEMVIKRSSTQSLDRTAPGFLDALNRYGSRALHGKLPGYAGGGQVAPVPGRGRRHTSGYPWATWAGDYPQPMGTPVRSWKDGITALVRKLATSYGHHVRINHDDGTSSLYAHLSKIMTFVGQRVLAGQTIGRVGSTGNSTGPHLHFETMGGAFTGGTPVMSGSAEASSGFNIGEMIKEAASKYIGKKVTGGGIFGDFLNAIPGRLVEGVVNKATEMFSNSVAGQGTLAGGVERWRPMVLQALARVGQSTSLVDTTLRRMNQESGGNPQAINNWDINAKNGTPSKGLMQVIDPTFRAYRDKGLPNNIWDPLANTVASMRYALSRYGSLASAYNRPGGYLFGGITSRTQTPWLSEDGRPELVVGPQRGRLKAGTRVYDGNETADLMGPRTTITNNHITLQVDMSSVRDIRTLMEFLQRWELETHGS